MTAPRPHDVPMSRRAAKVLRDRVGVHIDRPAQHARRRKRVRFDVVAGLAVAGALVVGSSAAVTAAVSETTPPQAESATVVRFESQVDSGTDAVTDAAPEPAGGSGEAAFVPHVPAAVPPPPLEETVPDICGDTAVTDALAAGDDIRAVTAAGGAAVFRDAIALGLAPCVPLDDPARVWVVVNKARPYAPIDYAPASVMVPDGVRNDGHVSLRPDAAAALTAMVAAARADGAGEIALESAYRSFQTQEASYAAHVADKGAEVADVVSARPGHSEHQSGLTVDLVPCDAGGCGSIDALAASTQGAWLVAHAHEHGWIVRYEDGYTPVTGYLAEPWHLRYIGVELATAYRDGGWHTLEEFFGLPPAPDDAG